ncbi:hypothetical protein [Streptomyces sp. NPDC058297]
MYTNALLAWRVGILRREELQGMRAFGATARPHDRIGRAW